MNGTTTIGITGMASIVNVKQMSLESLSSTDSTGCQHMAFSNRKAKPSVTLHCATLHTVTNC
jgi:hypothetical protein